MLICVCVSGTLHLSWGFLFPRMYMYSWCRCRRKVSIRWQSTLAISWDSPPFLPPARPSRCVESLSLLLFNSGSYWEKKDQIQIFSFCLFIFPCLFPTWQTSDHRFPQCTLQDVWFQTWALRCLQGGDDWRRLHGITLLFEIDFLVMFCNQPSLIQFFIFVCLIYRLSPAFLIATVGLRL
jgi:hypothetical protein